MITTWAMIAVAGLAADDVSMKFIGSGVTARVGGYVPLSAEMNGTADSVKKAPKGLEAAKYGTLNLGSQSWTFILDEPEGKPAKLYVDTNGDGDLTNDPAARWASRKDGDLTSYSGTARVDLGGGKIASVNMYRFDPTDSGRPKLKNTMMFYPDYGYELTLTLDGKQFTTAVAGEPGPMPIWIDRDGNKLRSSKRETVRLGSPFNFTGTTYVLKRDSGEFKLEQASTALPIAPMPPDLTVGKQAIAFEMAALDGTKIDFPKSYAGKLVMLDFWATWCGPCIAELPNVKKAYAAWHDKGFEILGISFDNPNMEEKVKSFLQEHDLPWPQIYEGKGWTTTLGEQYDVSAIPFVLLVDGDSGEILATVNNLRGPGLSDFIGRQLAKKNGRPPVPLSVPKSQLDLSNLRPAALELVAEPDLSRELVTFQTAGRSSSSNYVPTNPAVTSFVSSGSQAYKVIDGGLRAGSLAYTDRKFKITELPEPLQGLTLLQTKMGHKGIVDGRFSIVLSSDKPCYVFVALTDQTLQNHSQFGVPFWLQEFSATDFSIATDNPISGPYQVFVKFVPGGRIALGPCCSDPLVSSMYFAFAAEAK